LFLNVLPFRVKDLSSEITELQIGLLYLGYSMGIIVSLLFKKIMQYFKSELNTIIFALGLFLSRILFVNLKSVLFSFITLFIFCIVFFYSV
jgi:YNFM family putative membrane transporter